MRRWITQALLPAGGATLVVLLILFVGHWTREALRGDSAKQFPFRDIDCQAPVGRTRDEFLAEVQYLSGIPDRLDLLDPSLAERLVAVFQRDPWVDSVPRIEIGPHTIKASLHFRQPVLIVPVEGAKEVRLVDRLGIQLPGDRIPARLIRSAQTAPKPAGLPGTSWGDPRIADAARLAALLHPQYDLLNGNHSSDNLELTLERDGTFVLNGSPTGPILWGRPPGKERDGEPGADEKLRTLFRHFVGDGSHPARDVLDLSKATSAP